MLITLYCARSEIVEKKTRIMEKGYGRLRAEDQ